VSDTEGVVVEEVVPGDSVGIGKGDIIFQVDGEDVNNQDQFLEVPQL
jgi:S1-C subfamily serine protease